MRRSIAILFALILTLGTVAGAQDAAAPAAPVTTETNETMVRFLHAAPNAEVDSVVLAPAEGEATELEQFAGIAYGEMSEYVAVPPGGYEVSVSLGVVEGEEASEAVVVPADALDTFASEYYTIVLMGVVPPPEGEEAEEGGFFEWLGGLFTGEDDQFGLRAMVISDVTQFVVAEDEAEVRIVHAAPGTEAVDLVLVDADGADAVHSVGYGYGDVSGFDRLVTSAGTLELRVAGSEAVMLDLSDQQLESGASYTLFLIGTPVEDAPLEVIVERNPLVSTTALTPAVPGAVPPALATDQTWMRDSLNEIEARLAAIEERLRNMVDVEGAQEDANAALEEVAQAMALINDTRDQMAAQPAAVPAVPPAPETTEPDGDAD